MTCIYACIPLHKPCPCGTGLEIVIEEFLAGEEASFFALIDGRTCVPLASAQVMPCSKSSVPTHIHTNHTDS